MISLIKTRIILDGKNLKPPSLCVFYTINNLSKQSFVHARSFYFTQMKEQCIGPILYSYRDFLGLYFLVFINFFGILISLHNFTDDKKNKLLHIFIWRLHCWIMDRHTIPRNQWWFIMSTGISLIWNVIKFMAMNKNEIIRNCSKEIKIISFYNC